MHGFRKIISLQHKMAFNWKYYAKNSEREAKKKNKTENIC